MGDRFARVARLLWAEASNPMTEVPVQIAVLTFDGFNELDSFVAAAIVNRMKAQGWAAHITSPTSEVTSMNGVTVQRQKPLARSEEHTSEHQSLMRTSKPVLCMKQKTHNNASTTLAINSIQ